MCGYSFNQSVDKLPSSLTHLTLGESFNNSIDNIPNTITILNLCNNYQLHITKLPANLKYLSINTTKYLEYNYDSEDEDIYTEQYDVEYIKSIVNNNCIVNII